MAEIKMIFDESNLATYPHVLSEDRRSRFNCTIRRPTMRHVALRPWSSIAIDQTLQIAPRHLRAINNMKNWFKLEKLIFNSRKSLKIQKNSEKI